MQIPLIFCENKSWNIFIADGLGAKVFDCLDEQQSLLRKEWKRKVSSLITISKLSIIDNNRVTYLVVQKVIFSTIPVGTRETFARRASMDMIRLSSGRIARIALHRLFKKRLGIFSIDFAFLICFVGPESRCCQVIIVNYLQNQ